MTDKEKLKLRWADWAAEKIDKICQEEQEIADLSELMYFKQLMEINKYYKKINGNS